MDIKESSQSKYWQQKFSVTVDLAGEYLVKLAIAEFPFLALPVVKQSFSYLVKKIISKSQEEGQLMISFVFIDKEVAHKNTLYVEAVTKLKEVLDSDIPEEKKNEALEETKKRLRDLIRFPVK
jgi:hypothetical protein